MTLVLLVLLVLLLAGGGWGYRSGYHTGPYSVVWIILLVLLS